MFKQIKKHILKNYGLPLQSQGCTVWPLSQTAICTVYRHRTADLEAARGTCTGLFAWAHPLDTKPELYCEHKCMQRNMNIETGIKKLPYYMYLKRGKNCVMYSIYIK